jgi:hypothetical protein
MFQMSRSPGSLYSLTPPVSPQSTTSSSSHCSRSSHSSHSFRGSWCRKSPVARTAGDNVPVSPWVDNEHERILQARQRLARREVELRQIVRYCNSEMDVVRQKLCKDLGVLEVLKGEIEKAGTGPLREELEQDFHDGIALYDDD